MSIVIDFIGLHFKYIFEFNIIPILCILIIIIWRIKIDMEKNLLANLFQKTWVYTPQFIFTVNSPDIEMLNLD